MSDVKTVNAVEVMANVLSTEAYAINQAADRLNEQVADGLCSLFNELIVLTITSLPLPFVVVAPVRVPAIPS